MITKALSWTLRGLHWCHMGLLGTKQTTKLNAWSKATLKNEQWNGSRILNHLGQRCHRSELHFLCICKNIVGCSLLRLLYACTSMLSLQMTRSTGHYLHNMRSEDVNKYIVNYCYLHIFLGKGSWTSCWKLWSCVALDSCMLGGKHVNCPDELNTTPT